MVSSDGQKVQRLKKELQVLTEVSKTLASKSDLLELLNSSIDKIVDVLEPADIGCLILRDHLEGLIRSGAAFGEHIEISSNNGITDRESLIGKILDKGQAKLLCSSEEILSVMSDDRAEKSHNLPHIWSDHATLTSILAVPVAKGEMKFGMLILGTMQSPETFTGDDIPFVQTLGDLIALTIERARIETKADSYRDELEAENLRAEIMATLSHELRMPLTAIRGYVTALLLDEVEWDADKQLEFLNLVDEECENMQVMITEILDSSLIDIKQLTIEPVPLRLQNIAHDLAAEIQLRTNLHRIIGDIPDDFPIVNADPRWIKQVFRNILENAIKYSPEGGLIVIDGEERHSDVVISISDQGIGISPEDLISLFDKYFRVKLSPGSQVPGTGLGLPIARSIVEAHGGRIWAESTVGEGTTLSFSLPKVGSS